MQKKQILVLSLLAAGIAIELILMVGLWAGRGNSEQTLSTISTSIAWGETTNQTAGTLDGQILPPEGTAQIDEDMLGAAPESGSEATPIFAPTIEGGAADGSFGDGSSGSFGSGSFGSGYPGPGSGSSGYSWPSDTGGVTTGGSSGGNFTPPENSYPAPPTQPAGPQEPWPTDVPAATEAAPTSSPSAPTAAAPTPTPTNTEPVTWLPTSIAEFQPTTTLQAQPTNTIAAQPANTAIPNTTLPAITTTAQPVQPTVAGTTAPTAAATSEPTAMPTAVRTAAPTTAPFSGLISVHASAPSIDGSGSDAAWSSAPAVNINTSGGANHGSTNVTARSVYDGDSVYFLFTWEDPTQSFLRNPWERQPDGSWKRLESPQSGFNDENVYYEDKLALLWPVRGISDFSSAGCGGACHTGENADAKPYGNMYTPGKDSLADLWQWKSVRGAGQVDDQFLDSTRYSKDAPSAGFHPDPDNGGGYRNNQSKDKKAPAYMPPNGGQKNGAPGYITEAEKVDLDPKLFKSGERVPSILTAPWKGDRGDIQAAWQYKDGRWTLELRRKLVTGSPYDVQFDDLGKVYSFGIAAFDNAQVRHSYQNGATSFRFQK